MLPPAERDYGIVFQSYALFPNLTRRRQRRLRAGQPQGAAGRRSPRASSELLKLVGLPGSGAKYPAQLSGGQQQRIALARALATSPGLLLLDEPLSALDALERVRLRQEIRSLQHKLGVTTIMVTHDQEEALSVADRIVVMNHGVIEQVGTPMEIYRDPATPFVADFVGKVNVLAGRLHPGRRPAHRRQPLRLRARHRPGARGQGLPASGGRAGAADRRRATRNVFDGAIDKIEFLGSYCLVRVNAEAMGSEPITVYLSLNYLAEQGLEVGSRLPLQGCCPSGCASSEPARAIVSAVLSAARRARPAPARALDRPRRARRAAGAGAGAGRLPGAAARRHPRQGAAGRRRRLRRPRQLRRLLRRRRRCCSRSWNSVWVSALVTVITVPLAFGFAYALTRSCMPLQGRCSAPSR